VAGKARSPLLEAGVLDPWEAAWAPYDEATYREVVAHLHPSDVLIDIGAGDLRLARRAALRVQRVYAIERQASVVARGLRQRPGPSNMYVVVADARWFPFPADATVAVLLMRHCRHFRLYVEKLRATRCRRLITNARWRMGVEVIDLRAPRLPFSRAGPGWYACLCGAVGFIPTAADRLTPEIMARVQEVIGCPACDNSL